MGQQTCVSPFLDKHVSCDKDAVGNSMSMWLKSGSCFNGVPLEHVMNICMNDTNDPNLPSIWVGAAKSENTKYITNRLEATVVMKRDKNPGYFQYYASNYNWFSRSTWNENEFDNSEMSVRTIATADAISKATFTTIDRNFAQIVRYIPEAIAGKSQVNAEGFGNFISERTKVCDNMRLFEKTYDDFVKIVRTNSYSAQIPKISKVVDLYAHHSSDTFMSSFEEMYSYRLKGYSVETTSMTSDDPSKKYVKIPFSADPAMCIRMSKTSPAVVYDKPSIRASSDLSNFSAYQDRAKNIFYIENFMTMFSARQHFGPRHVLMRPIEWVVNRNGELLTGKLKSGLMQGFVVRSDTLEHVMVLKYGHSFGATISDKMEKSTSSCLVMIDDSVFTLSGGNMSLVELVEHLSFVYKRHMWEMNKVKSLVSNKAHEFLNVVMAQTREIETYGKVCGSVDNVLSTGINGMGKGVHEDIRTCIGPKKRGASISGIYTYSIIRSMLWFSHRYSLFGMDSFSSNMNHLSALMIMPEEMGGLNVPTISDIMIPDKSTRMVKGLVNTMKLYEIFNMTDRRPLAMNVVSIIARNMICEDPTSMTDVVTVLTDKSEVSPEMRKLGRSVMMRMIGRYVYYDEDIRLFLESVINSSLMIDKYVNLVGSMCVPLAILSQIISATPYAVVDDISARLCSSRVIKGFLPRRIMTEYRRTGITSVKEAVNSTCRSLMNGMSLDNEGFIKTVSMLTSDIDLIAKAKYVIDHKLELFSKKFNIVVTDYFIPPAKFMFSMSMCSIDRTSDILRAPHFYFYFFRRTW